MQRALIILLVLSLPSLSKRQEQDAQAAGPANQPPGWTPERMIQVKDITSAQPSPDGRRVAFAVRQAVMDGEKSEYLTQIHVANSDGTRAFQLTQGEKSSEAPQWSPDGQ